MLDDHAEAMGILIMMVSFLWHKLIFPEVQLASEPGVQKRKGEQ